MTRKQQIWPVGNVRNPFKNSSQDKASALVCVKRLRAERGPSPPSDSCGGGKNRTANRSFNFSHRCTNTPRGLSQAQPLPPEPSPVHTQTLVPLHTRRGTHGGPPQGSSGRAHVATPTPDSSGTCSCGGSCRRNAKCNHSHIFPAAGQKKNLHLNLNRTPPSINKHGWSHQVLF